MSYDDTVKCQVWDCDRPASLLDTTIGEIWTYRAYYCAPCYEKLLLGAELPFDRTRLEVIRTERVMEMAVSSHGY